MMYNKLIEMVETHELVNVAVGCNGIDCCFIIEIDEYEYNGDDLIFGNADQEICIHNLSECEIVENFDEVYVSNGDKTTAVSLCFIR